MATQETHIHSNSHKCLLETSIPSSAAWSSHLFIGVLLRRKVLVLLPFLLLLSSPTVHASVIDARKHQIRDSYLENAPQVLALHHSLLASNLSRHQPRLPFAHRQSNSVSNYENFAQCGQSDAGKLITVLSNCVNSPKLCCAFETATNQLVMCQVGGCCFRLLYLNFNSTSNDILVGEPWSASGADGSSTISGWDSCTGFTTNGSTCNLDCALAFGTNGNILNCSASGVSVPLQTEPYTPTGTCLANADTQSSQGSSSTPADSPVPLQQASHLGVIIGISLGVVAVVVIVFLMLCCLCRRKQCCRRTPDPFDGPNEASNPHHDPDGLSEKVPYGTMAGWNASLATSAPLGEPTVPAPPCEPYEEPLPPVSPPPFGHWPESSSPDPTSSYEHPDSNQTDLRSTPPAPPAAVYENRPPSARGSLLLPPDLGGSPIPPPITQNSLSSTGTSLPLAPSVHGSVLLNIQQRELHN